MDIKEKMEQELYIVEVAPYWNVNSVTYNAVGKSDK